MNEKEKLVVREALRLIGEVLPFARNLSSKIHNPAWLSSFISQSPQTQQHIIHTSSAIIISWLIGVQSFLLMLDETNVITEDDKKLLEQARTYIAEQQLEKLHEEENTGKFTFE